MPKNKKKKDSWWFWLVIGLIAYLVIAPNSTIMRVMVQRMEPLEFTFLRSALIVIVALPLIIKAIPKFNKRNLVNTLGAGLSMTIATMTMAYAVKYSTASYVAVMMMIAPVLLVVLSSRFMGDKISRRAIAGVAIAATGTLLVVVAPLVLSGNTNTQFYPLATALMLVNNVFFTLAILFSRRSNEEGMPLAANSGMMSIVIAGTSFVGMYAVHGLPTNLGSFSPQIWLGIFYSGVIVIFIARVLSIASYERVGAATSGGLNYLASIISILIPIVVLGEQLPISVAVGGVVILLGVLLTEKHRATHRHHRYMQTH